MLMRPNASRLSCGRTARRQVNLRSIVGAPPHQAAPIRSGPRPRLQALVRQQLAHTKRDVPDLEPRSDVCSAEDRDTDATTEIPTPKVPENGGLGRIRTIASSNHSQDRPRLAGRNRIAMRVESPAGTNFCS